MGSRIIRPRWLMLGGLVSIGCGIVVTELAGQHPVHDRAPPPCILNYPCLPRRETWGYYPPKWRRWPGVPATAVPTPEELDAGLPDIQPPAPEVEEQRAPAPLLRSVPLEPEAATEGDVPAPAGPAMPAPAMPAPAMPGPGGGLRPFEPTPAAEPPAGEDGLGPFRSAPIPGTPFPGMDGPDETATPEPEPAPVPTPLNPFDGAEADTSRFQDDPPPALPPSLQSTRKAHDAKLATQAERGSDSLEALLTRLPQTTPAASTGQYAVQQASATVWASGTKDIRPADPNAGRVEQAIHHEPIE